MNIFYFDAADESTIHTASLSHLETFLSLGPRMHATLAISATLRNELNLYSIVCLRRAEIGVNFASPLASTSGVTSHAIREFWGARESMEYRRRRVSPAGLTVTFGTK